MIDQRCRLCGTRASAFGSYETCRVDGPSHEWENLPTCMFHHAVTGRCPEQGDPYCPTHADLTHQRALEEDE